MALLDAIGALLHAIRREPGRVALTLFGVVLGSAIIVLLASALTAAGVAFGKIAQNATGDDVVRVTQRRAEGIQRVTARVELTEHDKRAMAAHEGLDPDVEAVQDVWLFEKSATVGKKRKAVGLQSGGSQSAKMSHLEIAHGRWLRDDEDGARVALIGHAIFKDLFEGEWPLPNDGLLLFEGVPLRVVGVLAPRPTVGGESGTWQLDRKVFISNATLERTLGSQEGWREVVLRETPKDDGVLPSNKAVAKRLDGYLLNLHRGVRNFEFDALNAQDNIWELLPKLIGAVLFGCALVALFVGGINVMCAQIVSVHERTREYGIRRALGLSKRALLRAVLVESLLYTQLGSVVGIAGGAAAVTGLAHLLHAAGLDWPMRVLGWSVACALGASGVVGLLAGIVPALRASRIEVAECLRDG